MKEIKYDISWQQGCFIKDLAIVKWWDLVQIKKIINDFMFC